MALNQRILLSAGSNAHGQLSNTSIDDSHQFAPCSFSNCPPGTLPADSELLHLALGANHTIALLQFHDGARTELWGCGDGKSGQLGPLYEDDKEITILRPLTLPLERHGMSGYLPRLVAASWETSYVVLSRKDNPDVLISMGADDFGDLGIGTKREGKLPARDFHVVGLGHLSASVDLGSLVVESLAAGQHHVIVTLKSALGRVSVGWGTSRHGQLGDVVEKPFASSPTLLSNHDIVLAALGHQHTVFLHSSGSVSGMGSRKKRQLDGVDGILNARDVACSWTGTYVTTGDEGSWRILSAGNNANGQLGRLDDLHGALAPIKFPFTSTTHRLLRIACGSEHVLASFMVLASSATEVWGWGWNEHGNLGIGSTEDVRLPVKIWPPDASQTLHRCVEIWAGSGTSWIVVQ
ncbi:secretion-regulating guanine nucleotide exchange factor [Favolaschia claudopus]|uniref:Secretion-regulating guanine nucleotide exchange factor n=1 Tax=Favolaschia claudopus TaxID=2862362 RepID=A0AAW0EGJ6_9AGAR